MVRPQKRRIVAYNPDISYFKPRGIPLIDLEEVQITIDEYEALRLSDLLDMPYEEAAVKMKVSRATFGRIVRRARKTVADALINGKAIIIQGGNYRIVDKSRIFVCNNCNKKWKEPRGTGRPENCPLCNQKDFYRI
ncbi:MAG: DUF134 domain-containing protein [Deltaproteobacteria bacterium]|nr:DUF134 domain-containing protein [Deltaproteobacteria bacterium]